MALEQIPHRQPDGTLRIENRWTPLEGESTIHVIQTGPVRGYVELADGTAYDVTPEHIQVSEKDGHVEAVHYRIAKMHEASGHLTHILHGPGWTGSAATIDGDESGFSIVAGVETPKE